MFWGLIMEPGRCYTQKVKVSFHVSMAALDISNSSEDPVQVMCVFEGRNYLLCTLHKEDKVQCSLDLNFEAGSKVSFATNGKAHVHLTGYLTNLDDDLFDEEMDEEEEEEAVVSSKDKKRSVKGITDEPPKKRTKTANNSFTKVEAEEEESSDSDFDLDHLVKEETLDEEDSSEEDNADEEEDDEDGEEEDEVASSLSEEQEEESEEEKEVKPKQNGVAKTKTLPQQKVKKEQQKPQEKVSKEKPKQQEKAKKKIPLKSGVVMQELKEGSGRPAKSGNMVHVYYEGRLNDTNKMFDSTVKGPGFAFRLGRGEVIKGWDIGLVGMKVGGKRRIICPPNAAYGSDGSPPVIPPHATLVFDVELKKVS